MALVPKVITSLINEEIILDDVRGFAGGEVRIPALAANLDLTTMATEDALAASFHLAHIANVGDVTVNQGFTVGVPFPAAPFTGNPYPDASMGYALSASSTITNVGASVITGDLDLYPGTSVTGFPPGVVHGAQNIANATAQSSQASALAAFTAANALGGATVLTGDLHTHSPLAPGVYSYASSAALTGTLVLAGSPSDTWVFQIGTTLTTASASVMSMSGGAVASNVLWAVGSSATLGTGSTLEGNVIADASISLNGGNTVNGQLAALTGAITIAGASTVTAPSSFNGVTWA